MPKRREYATRRAWIRAWWLWITRNDVQRCGYCGCTSNQLWAAPDDFYAQVTDGYISCTRCFDKLARSKGYRISWLACRADQAYDLAWPDTAPHGHAALTRSPNHKEAAT